MDWADSADQAAFRDEVREKTLELIEKKVAGQEITAAPAEESKTKIIDLMAALKASIEESGATTDRKPAARAGKKAGATKSAAKKSGKKAASG